MEPPSKRTRKFFEDNESESDGDNNGVSGFKINKEFARKYEHNQKRKERAELQRKFATNEEDDSEEEDEDEDGELATEALDSEIQATLSAIKSKDPRLYDKNVNFYSEFTQDETAGNQSKKEKPMYLRDYHRQNLLNGEANAEDEETPKTFAQEQAELKNSVIREMHAAADVGDDEEDDFLVAKSKPEPETKTKGQLDVDKADQDPERFLSDFMTSRAWIPTKSTKFLPFESDDEDQENKADDWEEAYNFRFEDPNKMNEHIQTHARDTANQLSVRREGESGRKKKREAERQKKEGEKRERETEKSRLRRLKMEELEEKVEKIKKAAGLTAADFTEEEWAQFLDGNWDDGDWEKEMAKRFGEEYYAAEEDGINDGGEPGSKKNRRPKKPTWDDDIDIKDLVPDFDDEAEPGVDLTDEDAADDVDGEEDEEDGATKKKKKSHTQEKHEKRRSARKERRRIEEAVERNLELAPNLLPGATKKNSSHFRYRETSPQSFGLTARDILMADDTQLNQFVGLKKLAAFRDPERKRRDQKKMGKKSRLRQWRKDTFGDEEGPKFELVQDSGTPDGQKHVHGGDKGDEMEVDIREGSSGKKRKRSRKH
ncbi:KRI1-like family C-terminal-domain-containing protein [Talaromyces proteolyticus]|uniref:KRI1-like family C-terminal-domain-containing protein n=1 Tax=Talaromyces proteolyticus TaxID=1131652 RepID=A0AAD4KJF0_9EURO|nr:KRI1-like family C-terminal-domain-containing protein [Talaromyces proteolyticus]KAH8692870.1 KRI1-like family C-terminal-domain-containing protein [Talaromyces proteolyticus]